MHGAGGRIHRGIVPPHVLKAMARAGHEFAWQTLTVSSVLTGQRQALGAIPALLATPAGEKWRTVYDAHHAEALPGGIVRGEGDPKRRDGSINEAYDGSGVVYDFFEKVFERRSIDARGMELDSSVHYGLQYDNAFWDGRQMVYGDGDGRFFGRFTASLDVIAHELTHGVTQNEADLAYQGQAGALNESMSDVFGSLVKQWAQGEGAAEADWLIGEGLFTSAVRGKALRNMKEPGTAYDDPVLGKDPQPGHMRDYVETGEDNGGVHINSGIPNRAFVLTALALGGKAWERAGRVWYVALRDVLKRGSDFRAAAKITGEVAGKLYGPKSREAAAVASAWRTVGVA